MESGSTLTGSADFVVTDRFDWKNGATLGGTGRLDSYGDLAIDNNFPRRSIAASVGIQHGSGFPILCDSGAIGVVTLLANFQFDPGQRSNPARSFHYSAVLLSAGSMSLVMLHKMPYIWSVVLNSTKARLQMMWRSAC